MVRKIPCSVLGEYVKGAGVSIGAKGSADDVALELTFSSAWDDTTKTLVWVDARGIYASTQILTADMYHDGVYTVPITAEAKGYEGIARMSIKGSIIDDNDVEQTIVSATAGFVVLPSVWEYNEAEDVTPTIAEQLQAEIDAILGDVEDAIQAAEDAKGYSESAADDAETASESKDTAVASATLSESWAVGGTGTRAGEDTNNAKFWCEQAEEIVGGDFVTHTEFNNHTEDTNNPHQVSAADVGLGNVDNTADADKPVSSAQWTAINAVRNDLSGGSGATIAYLEDNKAQKSIADSVEIAVSDWSLSGGKYVATKSVAYVYDDSNVIVTPAPSSWDDAIDNNVRCTAQAGQTPTSKTAYSLGSRAQYATTLYPDDEITFDIGTTGLDTTASTKFNGTTKPVSRVTVPYNSVVTVRDMIPEYFWTNTDLLIDFGYGSGGAYTVVQKYAKVATPTGTLTFTADTLPDDAITMNVLIVG